MPPIVHFFPLVREELTTVNRGGVTPQHVQYQCGACGLATNGRRVASCKRKDGAVIHWILCSCPKEEPTIMVAQSETSFYQLPISVEFSAGERWPTDLATLFTEASKAFAAGAFTASAMVARKVLMACACHESAEDGKPFGFYVDYILTTVLPFPRAKDSIDRIRKIGNEANHSVEMVNPDDARRALQIVKYMLDTIYSLPSA